VSAATSYDKYLNDYLFAGPKLQQDLSEILVRFRLHSVVFTADMRQMFRQIAVTSKHHTYQRLLYYFKLKDSVQKFQMTTVTFSQRSSTFLAIRTLQQFASENAFRSSEGSSEGHLRRRRSNWNELCRISATLTAGVDESF